VSSQQKNKHPHKLDATLKTSNLGGIGNQFIESDHLNEIRMMGKFVEFISFIFNDKEMIVDIGAFASSVSASCIVTVSVFVPVDNTETTVLVVDRVRVNGVPAMGDEQSSGNKIEESHVDTNSPCYIHTSEYCDFDPNSSPIPGLNSKQYCALLRYIAKKNSSKDEPLPEANMACKDREDDGW
ncbi:hypothetical protein Tco_1047982, partial [Tanacetum coccineum]